MLKFNKPKCRPDRDVFVQIGIILNNFAFPTIKRHLLHKILISQIILNILDGK